MGDLILPSTIMPCWRVKIPAERINTMLKPIVTYIGKINVIQNRKDLILVTDSFEVKWILDYLGYHASGVDDVFEFSGLFVTIMDGDYGEVFAFEGCVPYLFKDLWMIDIQKSKDG